MSGFTVVFFRTCKIHSNPIPWHNRAALAPQRVSEKLRTTLKDSLKDPKNNDCIYLGFRATSPLCWFCKPKTLLGSGGPAPSTAADSGMERDRAAVARTGDSLLLGLTAHSLALGVYGLGFGVGRSFLDDNSAYQERFQIIETGASAAILNGCLDHLLELFLRLPAAL